MLTNHTRIKRNNIILRCQSATLIIKAYSDVCFSNQNRIIAPMPGNGKNVNDSLLVSFLNLMKEVQVFVIAP